MEKTSRTRRTLVAAAVFLAVTFGGVVVTHSAENPPPPDSRISPRLLRVMEGAGSDPEGVPVVVITDSLIDPTQVTQVLSGGGVLRRTFGKVGGFAANVSSGGLKKLAAMPGLVSMTVDSSVRSLNDLNYVTVGADVASRSFGGPVGLDGTGITIAVLDSGIAAHPDLGARLVKEVQIVGHDKGFSDPYGHGTHVAGIIAGDGNASRGEGSFRRLNGIAPGARLVSVRVLDENGNGQVSDVLAGIDWVITHRQAYDIRILNLSLGHAVEDPVALDPLCRAVEAAWKAGILVVVAAGNAGASGYGSIDSPGNDPAVLTVGASNNYLTASRSDDILTSYTSRGPTAEQVLKPDLVAPGNRTVSLRSVGSTLDTTFPGLRVKEQAFNADPSRAGSDSLYFQLSGSSMAAGVVSGMAALMLQADPAQSPDTLKARLMRSAEKRPVYDIFSEGAGFADLAAALTEKGTAPFPALSPKVEWTPTGLLIQETGVVWGDTLWSLPAMYGSDPLRGTGSLWADPGLWVVSSSAAGDVSGSSVVWGGGSKVGSSSVVWGGGAKGSSMVGADSVVWGGGAKGSSTVGADSVVWGGGMQGTVSADSVVWGGGLKKSATDTTLLGDNVPQEP
ncbi:MAG TPA: S8 family peptidase [Candidatus Polarisedimenticolia bacterium]|nr:S8 family peptidase [Candidatus Polarisedimenticolia bacterium]